MPPTQNHCNMKFVSKNIQFVCLLIIPVILCMFFFLEQIFGFLVALIAVSTCEITEFDLCPKDKPYKFKNSHFCCSQPIQKGFDRCDGIKERRHHSSGCHDCKFNFFSIHYLKKYYFSTKFYFRSPSL